MNAIAPSIAESLNLFWLSRDVVDIPILHVAAGRRPLKIRIKRNAVWRVDVNALNPTAKSFPLNQRRHHLQSVAEDHAVCPVGVVLIELSLRRLAWQPIKICKEIDLGLRRLGVCFGAALQIVNQDFGMNLLLDI